MIAECNDVSCIQTDNLLKREGKYNVIIITSDTPIWPLNILSGCVSHCDITQYRAGGQRFQTAEVRRINRFYIFTELGVADLDDHHFCCCLG